MKAFFLFLSLSLLLSQPLLAKKNSGSSWISVTLPGVAVLQDDINSVYSIQGRLSGKMSGQMVALSLPIRFLPALGFDQTTLAVQGTNNSEAPSLVSTEIYNLIFDLSSKNTRIYFGVGKGSSTFDCKAASCATITAGTGSAQKIFLDFGIPFGKVSDLHLSVQQVKIYIPIDDGANSHSLDLTNFLVAIGIRYGF